MALNGLEAAAEIRVGHACWFVLSHERDHAAIVAARVTMQLDVGFGDVVTPGAVDITYPTLLDFPAPALSGAVEPWNMSRSQSRWRSLI